MLNWVKNKPKIKYNITFHHWRLPSARVTTAERIHIKIKQMVPDVWVCPVEWCTSRCQCWSPPVQRSKVKKEGSDWLGGGVIDQPLSVLKGNRDGVDGHALVLHWLPPFFDEAVYQDGHQNEDGQTQEGCYRYNSCESDQNQCQMLHVHLTVVDFHVPTMTRLLMLPVLLSDFLRSNSSLLANTSFSAIRKWEIECATPVSYKGMWHPPPSWMLHSQHQ